MAFTKGHPGYRKKGTKNRVTLLKEERRAIFEQEVSGMFLETIRAARPEYLLDQFLGKAADMLDVTTKGESLNSADEKALKIAAKAYADEVRKNILHEQSSE